MLMSEKEEESNWDRAVEMDMRGLGQHTRYM